MHDPERVAASLSAKLGARTRHLCMFIGAGASRACGLPDLTGLEAAVFASLEEPDRLKLKLLMGSRNIEVGLSRLRRVRNLLEDGEAYLGVTASEAAALDQRVCAAIIEALAADAADITPFDALAAWAGSGDYSRPIEFFTVNYDLLLERGLEARAVPYFDGFVGVLEGRFREDMVDDRGPGSDGLPTTFMRVWKLHGSVNWKSTVTDGRTHVVRVGHAVRDGATAAIYPSDEKYDDSRRVPFVVLQDRFRRALAVPETLAVVTGYSFGDAHLNDIIFDAAARSPRSEFCIFSYGDPPAHVRANAIRIKNLTVTWPTGAIIGGAEGPWTTAADVAGVHESGAFTLGDFRHLSAFLARSGGSYAT